MFVSLSTFAPFKWARLGWKVVWNRLPPKHFPNHRHSGWTRLPVESQFLGCVVPWPNKNRLMDGHTKIKYSRYCMSSDLSIFWRKFGFGFSFILRHGLFKQSESESHPNPIFLEKETNWTWNFHLESGTVLFWSPPQSGNFKTPLLLYDFQHCARFLWTLLCHIAIAIRRRAVKGVL